MPEKRKSYGNPQCRVAYDATKAATSDTKLALKECDVALEWLDRGQLNHAVDHLHLAYRFLGEVLRRQGVIEDDDDDED